MGEGALIFNQMLSVPEQGKVSHWPLPPGEGLSRLKGVFWWPVVPWRNFHGVIPTLGNTALAVLANLF